MIINLLKKIFLNKVLIYIVSRYATFLLQFINSLFIAVYLGPYYLGVWGFITLVLQYINQINFGIYHASNAITAIHRNRIKYISMILGTSFIMLGIIAMVLILFFVTLYIGEINFGAKFQFSNYVLPVVGIGILTYFNSLLSGFFRAFGRLTEISIYQSLNPLLTLVCLIFYKGSNLLYALVISFFISSLISFFIFLIRIPIKIKPIFDYRLIKKIQIKGWFLFIYNTSYNLVMASTRGFVSFYFSIEQFGYFTFSYSLGTVILLLLDSISFLIYPKLLNKMATANNDFVVELINKLRDAYITTSHLLAQISIFMFPFFLSFFPRYQNSSIPFALIVLTLVVFTNSFGYSAMLISKGFEKQLSYFALFTLIINVLFCYFFVNVLRVTFSSTVLATLISFFLYVFFVVRLGRKYLKQPLTFLNLFKDAFPLRLLLPFVLVLLILFFKNKISTYYIYFSIIPLFIFVYLNLKSLLRVTKIVKEILYDSSVIDIKLKK